MLESLSVSNYALIDSVDIGFSPGLVAITGETGSGKSILIGAFGLLLGGRAETRFMRDPGQKCVVEATFRSTAENIRSFLESHDLDAGEVVVVRREISPTGKSRAFINDSPVQLNVLRELGEQLVDIHSQHENSILGDRKFQFSVADAFAGNGDILREYGDTYREWTRLTGEIEHLQARAEEERQQSELAAFQFEELSEAGLDGLDQLQMEQELETLTHATAIRSGLLEASAALGEEGGALASLRQARQVLSKIAAFHPSLKAFSDRLESLRIETADLQGETEAFALRTESDESRIAWLNERLSGIYRLQQKYRVDQVAELIRIRESCASRMHAAAQHDENLAGLIASKSATETRLRALADALHQSRQQGAAQMSAYITQRLEALQLPQARLIVDLKPSGRFDAWGGDDIAFLFSANRGSALLPIRQVASGGEIARVMLALKAAISVHRQLPVLILDEIDQGVSGEVALRIGEILREMSSHMQVITITHLPQVAAKASSQLKVYKTDQGDRTSTSVRTLSEEERVDELAEMLGGKKRTQTSIDHARELLVRN